MKTRLLIIVLLLTFFGIQGAKATNYTWVGGNGAWTTASNWSPSTGYPGSGGSTTDIAIINTTNITITYNANLTVYGVTSSNYGVYGITLNMASGSNLNITTYFSIAQPPSLQNGFTFSGSGTATLGYFVYFSYQAGLGVNTGATVTFSSTSTVYYNNNNPNITNNGTINCDGCTFYSVSGITNNSKINLTNSASLNFSGTPSTITNNGTITATSSTINLNNNSNSIQNSSTATVYAKSSTFNLAGAGAFINNSGTFKATACSFPFGNGNYINNSGTFITQPSCTFTLSTSSSYMVNSGTFQDHGSTYTISGQSAYIQNTGSSAVMTLRGTTVNYSSGSNGSMALKNSNIFTADSLTKITLGTYQCSLTNTGIFNAGTSNSACIITLSAQASSITNSATFNLGSTSCITMSGYVPTVTNNSPGVFTLLSDQYGSASFGPTPDKTGNAGGGTYVGTFNVQRYLTGGSTNYRSYRLLSSPVNISSNTQGVGNITLNYINTNQSVVNANGVAGTTVFYGGLTAGPNGSTNGFTVANANPIIYIYNETLVSNSTTFVSGKYLGVTKVTSSTVDLLYKTTATTNVSIPVGNGFLYYFIGNNNSTVTAATRVPEATTLTAVGTINQQAGNSSSSVTYSPVTFWATGSNKLSYTSSYGTKAGFNLVGNPYPCVIDLQKVYSDNKTGSSFTTFWELNDQNPNQGYVSYNGKDSTKSSTALSSRFIASGQGFIVQATSNPANQTITFKEDQKVYSPSGIINSFTTIPILLSTQNKPGKTLSITGKTTNALSINANNSTAGMHLMLQKDSSTFRECGIYFNKKYVDTYNEDDAYDLDGPGLKVFLSSYTSDNVRTGINALNDYTKGKRINLYVNAQTTGLYHLNLTDIASIDTNTFNVYLVDKYKNDSLDMVRYKSYAFDITVDTNSYGSNRFLLAIERRPLPPYQLIAFNGQKVTGGIQIDWKTYNEGNYTGFVLQKLGLNNLYAAIDSLQSSSISNYSYTDHGAVTGSNTYRLQQNDIDGRITYSAPVTITYNNSSAPGVFSIYPNPSKELITINVSAVKSAASYSSNIYNTAGELIGHRTVSGNTWTEDITSYRTGVYVIELRGNDGNLIGKSKFVKTN